MKILRPLAASIAVILASSSMSVMAGNAFDVLNQTAGGAPSFVVGQLGSTTVDTSVAALKNIIATEVTFGANGNEDFTISRQWTDDLGKSHTHVAQTINGLNVYGTSMIIHTEAANAQGEADIYAMTGNLAVNNEPQAQMFILQSNAHQNKAKALASEIGDVNGEAELAYIYLPELDETKLAWRMEVSWTGGNEKGSGDFGRDFVYFDAHSSKLLTRHAQVHAGAPRETYTLNGGSASSAPGTLVCSNNESCGNNAAAQRASDGAEDVYAYYVFTHGRGSLDDANMTLVSSVDMGVQNAYWTGTQVIYGQAGGAVDNDFTSSFDIIAHEFTHGVIDHSAKLVYQSESGALNEAWSDIFGVTIKARVANRSSSNWLLGDGLFNTPYKAVRYMNDPTKDGTSKDYYPERYTGTSDNSGVHRNSGIANLAYVLMVQGGTHPRDKTTVTVPSIGMDKAEKIFYRALTTYMTQNTDFAGARTATASAADDLYGATVKEAVETAWCAVGVGYCPGPVIDPPNNELRNWVTETGLSASKGKDLIYTMQMPKHVTNIKFDMSGGTGDADMYVKFGSAPTDNSYDCRPYKSGNVETCNPTSKDGTYYVRVKAYSSFSGVSLTGSYTSIVIDPIPGVDETIQNIAVSQGQWQRYTQVLYNGATDLKVTISGGNGDADLYVRHGAQSTISIYDCRPWKNGNLETCTFPSPDTGIWYLDVYGYSSASGVTMRVTANY